LWLDRKPDTSALDIAVDCCYLPEDFDSDGEEPFNGLTYLRPYHDSLIKYLQYRSKQKTGKQQEAKIAKDEYEDYVLWMRNEVQGEHRSKTIMRVKANV